MPAAVRFSEPQIRAAIRTSLSRALEIDETTLDDDRDFDAYGLPSLEAVELAAELEDFLGREIDAEAIFEHPTIARLAQHLARAA